MRTRRDNTIFKAGVFQGEGREENGLRMMSGRENIPPDRGVKALWERKEQSYKRALREVLNAQGKSRCPQSEKVKTCPEERFKV